MHSNGRAGAKGAKALAIWTTTSRWHRTEGGSSAIVVCSSSTFIVQYGASPVPSAKLTYLLKNCHRNSGFAHYMKIVIFQFAMLVDQRVCICGWMMFCTIPPPNMKHPPLIPWFRDKKHTPCGAIWGWSLCRCGGWDSNHQRFVDTVSICCVYPQWEFQDPKLEVLYHIRPYFVGIFPYIGLIYGRYLQFRISISHAFPG